MTRRSLLAGSVAAWLAVAGGVTACSVSQDQEVSIGARDAAQVDAQLPLIRDPAVTDYVNALGQRMAAHTSRADLTWHFQVVDAAEANAFALPGGYVYVNRGLIDLTRTESELAGAIGHEIGHVVERHAIRQMESQQTANIGLTALCTLTNLCHSTLAQAAIQVGGAATFAKYSRADEAQADSEAIVNTLRAGIDPRGVPALFQRLLRRRQTQPTLVDAWFADHPMEESRIQHTDAILARLDPAQLDGLERDSPEYRAMRQALDALPAPPAPQPRAGAPAPSAGDTTALP